MLRSFKNSRQIHGSHLRVTRKQWHTRSLFLLLLALLFGNGLLNSLRKRSDQAIKVLPNDFDALGLSAGFVQEHIRRPIPLVNADEFRNGPYQYERGLGAGKEGSVDLYTHRDSGENVVVKRYRHGPEISWTRVPPVVNQSIAPIPQQWPSEISSALAIEAICNLEDIRDRFVPLRAFFFGTLDPHRSPAWHLVMPMMSGGSVGKLAEDLRSERASNVHDLDMRFRPAFEGLLAMLARLHARGLCHDDVKPSNFLLHDNITQWSLSDYGQVRGVAHPYHSTRLWIEARQWTKCKLNDVRRALKLYMAFLRNACENSDQFDAEFYAGQTPWSRLYWEYFQSPVSAQFLIDLSRSHMPGSLPANPGPSGEPPGLVPLRIFAHPSTVRRLAIDWELSTMLLGHKQCTWSNLALFGWDIETVAT
ncbi:hypothetical protein LTR70_009758 [Exophiala xenobiotica]|uniref:Protein kinase domain-containing protein n=1 Tax=Lithohypha guttulata TaxID=1690604 RepID=A0ABR0JWZ8_9EURO|nr:hypothetical protein LTR24_009560 [Lithohypha guttulata]KAK5310076.1 hypothetical protein LTR70_009758 [Exophiala xenobiotica]